MLCWHSTVLKLYYFDLSWIHWQLVFRPDSTDFLELFTDTSEHVCFFNFLVVLFSTFLLVGSV